MAVDPGLTYVHTGKEDLISNNLSCPIASSSPPTLTLLCSAQLCSVLKQPPHHEPTGRETWVPTHTHKRRQHRAPKKKKTMASDPAKTLAALQQHLHELQQQEGGGQDIELLTPSDPGFADARACYIRPPASAGPPLAIARPRTEAAVQALVRYCAGRGVDFVVRAGGHDCAGRSQVPGALTIDVRGLDRVRVAEDRKTVSIGGGVVFRDLAAALDPLGLVTPV